MVAEEEEEREFRIEGFNSVLYYGRFMLMLLTRTTTMTVKIVLPH